MQEYIHDTWFHVLLGATLILMLAGSPMRAIAESPETTADPVESIRAQCMEQWKNSSGLQKIMDQKPSSGLAELKDQASTGNFCAGALLVFVYGGDLPAVKANKALHSYWLDKLAAGGDLRAQEFAVSCYVLGVTKPEAGRCVNDPQRLFYWAVTTAKRNFSSAEFFLGIAYHKGFHVDKSEADANYWLTRAISHGYDAKAVENLHVGPAANADPDGMSPAARGLVASASLDLNDAEPADVIVSETATKAEAQSEYQRDLRKFRASYAQTKKAGESVCWEEGSPNITAFKRGQVESVRDDSVEVRYQLPGRPSTTITLTDNLGFTTTHEVGGSPPVDHSEWRKSGELGDCSLVTDEMVTQAQERSIDTTNELMRSILGGR